MAWAEDVSLNISSSADRRAFTVSAGAALRFSIFDKETRSPYWVRVKIIRVDQVDGETVTTELFEIQKFEEGVEQKFRAEDGDPLPLTFTRRVPIVELDEDPTGARQMLRADQIRADVIVIPILPTRRMFPSPSRGVLAERGQTL